MAYDEDFDPGYLQGEVMRLSAETDRMNEAANREARWRAVRSGQPLAPRGDRPLHEVDPGSWQEQPVTRTASYQDADAAYFTVARQLADRTGNSLDGVLALTQALATGNSEDEKADALMALSGAYAAIGNFPVAVSADDVLELSVSAPERRSLAGKGEAMGPEGDFPVPDKGHLVCAIARFKQGHYAGHPKEEVRAHIARNAKRLGMSVNLDDDADDDAGHSDGVHDGDRRRPMPARRDDENVSAAAQLARSARPEGRYSAADVLRLSADQQDDYELRELLLDAAALRDLADEQGMDAAEAEVVRLTREHPDMFGLDPAVSLAAKSAEGRRADAEAERLVGDHWDLFPASKVHELGHKQGKAHPAKSGRPVTTGTRAHSHDAEDASADNHAEVQRYLRELRQMNGANAEDDKGGVGGMYRVHRPGQTGCMEPGCTKNTSGPRSDYCAEHQVKGYRETPASIHKNNDRAHPREVR